MFQYHLLFPTPLPHPLKPSGHIELPYSPHSHYLAHPMVSPLTAQPSTVPEIRARFAHSYSVRITKDCHELDTRNMIVR